LLITLTGKTEFPKVTLPPIVVELVKNTKSPVLLPCAVADTVIVFPNTVLSAKVVNNPVPYTQ